MDISQPVFYWDSTRSPVLHTCMHTCSLPSPDMHRATDWQVPLSVIPYVCVTLALKTSRACWRQNYHIHEGLISLRAFHVSHGTRTTPFHGRWAVTVRTVHARCQWFPHKNWLTGSAIKYHKLQIQIRWYCKIKKGTANDCSVHEFKC